MNRGIAKRVCFPDRAAKRRFLALVACSVRRGEIEVESFSILDTHFHMLVRSTGASLSYAMMRIQNAYVRYFNRRFRRDGPLFRNRFLSIPVHTTTYARILVRYIDHNPVSAGLCDEAALYPFGSAYLYATRESGPRWLLRKRVEAWVRAVAGGAAYDPLDYIRLLHAGPGHIAAELVELRLQRRLREPDPLDALWNQRPQRVAAWMRRKAQLADGLAPWAPVAAAAAIDDAVACAQTAHGAYRVRGSRKCWDGWLPMHAGLLHTGAGMRGVDIARRLGLAQSTVSRRVTLHLELLANDAGYARKAAGALQEALLRTHGTLPGR